jgi:hypothetical protein
MPAGRRMEETFQTHGRQPSALPMIERVGKAAKLAFKGRPNAGRPSCGLGYLNGWSQGHQAVTTPGFEPGVLSRAW